MKYTHQYPIRDTATLL